LLPRNDMGAMINKISLYVIYGLGVLCLVFLVQFYLSISGNGEHAIELGKRVVISVETGEVTMRDVGIVPDEPVELDPIEGGPEEPTEPEASEYEALYNSDAKLSIVIMGVGLNRKLADVIVKMPNEVAISFSPYIFDVSRWVNKAHDARHEVLIDLPMETSDYPQMDPGPYTLLTHAEKSKNLFRLKSVLSIMKAPVGLLTTPNEMVTRSLDAILPVIDELRKQNKVLIYNETPHNIFLDLQARSVGMSIIKQYFVIDDVLTEEAIDLKLKEALVRVQLGDESLLVVGRAYPITVSRVTAWMRKLKAANVRFSKVSDLIIKN
jgi:polysaccharide deacetylase 2 family uncharacterized protein YibQ